MKMWFMVVPLFFLVGCQLSNEGNRDTSGDTYTSLQHEPFTGFVMDVSDSSALVSSPNGLTFFSNITSDVQVGDRLIISHGEVRESFPAQADGKSSEVVSPPKPDSATYSEKEAIQEALRKAHELPAGDEHLDYRYVTFTDYVAEEDVWEITIQIYGEDEERIFQITADGAVMNQSTTLLHKSEFTGYLSHQDKTFSTIYTKTDGVIQFTNIDVDAEIGDRVAIEYSATTRSLPAQANGSNAQLVPAEKPEEASLTEKEAIQFALEIASKRSATTDPLLVVTAASYLDFDDLWEVFLQDFYADEEQYLLINQAGIDERDGKTCDAELLSDYEPTCFTGFVTENKLVSNATHGLITFSGLTKSIELGDRVDVVFYFVRESYPSSAEAHFTTIKTPPKPEGARYSEKEAIQLAIQLFHEQQSGQTTEFDFPPSITFTSYQSEDDSWEITIDNKPIVIK